MKLLRPLILITLIICFCFGNEVFTGYALNQNLVLESLPAKPIPRKATFGIIAAEFGGGVFGGFGGLMIGFLSGRALSPKSEDSEERSWIPILGFIGIAFGCAGGTCWLGFHFIKGAGSFQHWVDPLWE